MDNEVIEQAAKVLSAHRISVGDFIDGLEWDDMPDPWQDECRDAARALHAAGLLADPADRDEQPKVTATHRAKLERAEAEVAELRATVERVRAVHQPYLRTYYHASVTECTACIGHSYPCATIRALDGAGDAPNQQIGEQP